MNAAIVDEALREYRELYRQGKLNAAGLISLARLRNLQDFPAGGRQAGLDAGRSDAEGRREGRGGFIRASPCPRNFSWRRTARRTRFPLLQQALSKAPGQSDLWKALIDMAESRAGLGQGRATVGTVTEGVGRYRGATAVPGAVPRTANRCQGRRPFAKIGGERRPIFRRRARAALERPCRRRRRWRTIRSTRNSSCNGSRKKTPTTCKFAINSLEQALRGKNDAELEQALKEVERVAGQDAYWHYGQAHRLA